MDSDLIEREFELAIKKSWHFEYDGITIQVINEAYKEALFIDGTVVCQNERTGIASMIKPFQSLNANFIGKSGKSHSIFVKIGGFITLNIKVKINNELFFKDKHKIL